MKVAYQHLLSYIDGDPSSKEISDRLFQLGHEHEINNDVFDIEFTPNRGDCLSLRGLLRDLNLFYETNIEFETYRNDIKNFEFNFENNAQELCPKISFLKVDIKAPTTKYKNQLQKYFLDLDNKKINFFTDLSNYISYETGQPTHCYEADSLCDFLKLELVNNSYKFETLLDKTIELNEDNLAFFNNKDELINLAGVIGGKSTSCSKDTTSVIIECAYFKPDIILGKTVKYSINSDAAHKFERGVDPSCHEYVLRRFLKIIEEHATIKNVEIFSKTFNEFKQNKVHFDFKRIGKILGKEVCYEDCVKYLENLGFQIDDSLICVPLHRSDIKTLNDIAEEIARAIGYDNIDSKNFSIPSIKNKNKNQNSSNTEIKLKNLLIDNGFSEVLNDPFVFEHKKHSIKLDNPLDSNRTYLRTNLKESLIENLAFNERRQKDSVKLFEIADIYSLNSQKGERILGIIASGRVGKNHVDFSQIINNNYISSITSKHIHTNKDIDIENISRESINSKSKTPIVFSEIRLDDIEKVNYSEEKRIQNISKYKYVPISNFPVPIRDLSFSIKDFSRSEQLEEYILNFKDDLLKEVFIFDYFFNKKNDEIKIGFRFVFQKKDGTITERQVNSVMDVIIKFAYNLGVSIPGLNK